MFELNIDHFIVIDKSNTIDHLLLVQDRETKAITTCFVFPIPPTEADLKEKSTFNSYIVKDDYSPDDYYAWIGGRD